MNEWRDSRRLIQTRDSWEFLLFSCSSVVVGVCRQKEFRRESGGNMCPCLQLILNLVCPRWWFSILSPPTGWMTADSCKPPHTLVYREWRLLHCFLAALLLFSPEVKNGNKQPFGECFVVLSLPKFNIRCASLGSLGCKQMHSDKGSPLPSPPFLSSSLLSSLPTSSNPLASPFKCLMLIYQE